MLMKWLVWAILLVLIGIAFPAAWIIVGPLLVLLILGAILAAIFSPIGRLAGSRQNIYTRAYKSTREKLFELLIRTVSDLGHRLENANKDAGLVVFKTRSSLNTPSGHEGSIVIVPIGADTCEVRITMSYKGQLWDGGEGKKIAQNIFDRVEAEEFPEEIQDADEKAKVEEADSPKSILREWWEARRWAR